MPKADRILDNLPPTFRTLGDPSALRALADAYGGELQAAENTLVAVMRAHWVDFADAGQPAVLDLAGIGSLYGLAPRPDESVEEFRDHLKRFVGTHLDGTVTVRGLLRITAESLGLHIDEDLDAWWDRTDPVLVDSLRVGADAAMLVLGLTAVDEAGGDAGAAVLAGDDDLRAGVDLRDGHTLRIALDGHGAIPVDLTAAAADPARILPDEIAAAINAALPGCAVVSDGRLLLSSQVAGPAGEVIVTEGPGDAAGPVLGLRPRMYVGADATRARVVGNVDLSTPLDLTTERYLRLEIDGTRLAEVDCASAAGDITAVDIAEVADAINAALEVDVATHDGRFLTLTSPTPGRAGYVAFRQPAAQDATYRLFGSVPSFVFGTDSQAATAVGVPDLGPGVDLRDNPRLRIAVDGQPATTLDVLGVDPSSTSSAEIVAAVNEGLGAPVASHDGSRITMRSPTAGAAGSLAVEEVPGDAALPVLGLRPRTARGVPPRTASITGAPDLSGRVNLSERYLLRLAVDGQPEVLVDLRAEAEDITRVRVEELVAAVIAAVGADVAADDGAHLILASTSEGAAGRIGVYPVTKTRRRRFVTRAFVTDEAATSVLGFTARTSRGTPPTAARIVGPHDLGAGADLTSNRYVRLTVDDTPAVEVDCAGPRPRATTSDEIVAKINAGFPSPVASTDGRRITLLSPAEGAESRLALEPPRSRDALEAVLGIEPVSLRGRAPTGVAFAGTVDHSAGVELAADAILRIGVDGAAPVDVPVGDGLATSVRSLSAVVAAVNQALVAQVAAHDGRHLLLTSPTTGPASRLEIATPTVGTDATELLLGVAAPREYAGSDGTAAAVVGHIDLTAAVDLRRANLLHVAVDGGEAVDLDLSSSAADSAAVTASEIATAVNKATTAVSATVAVPGGLSVRIASPTTGLSSRLEVGRSGAGDAAPLLLGSAGLHVTGVAAQPAVLDGEVDLLAPVDMSERSVLRLRVDDGPIVDVDVAGVAPRTTLLAEIVNAINEELSGVAGVTIDQRLRLTSPTRGASGLVEVLPLRVLEVLEYLPAPAELRAPVRHGSVLRFRNAGTAAVPARLEVRTDPGMAGPRIADTVAGWSVRVDDVVSAGGSLTLAVEGGSVVATIAEGDEDRRVPPEHVQVAGADPLVVRRGDNAWVWSECRAARFDEAVFDRETFAGEGCVEDAVFDLSWFAPAPVDAVFAEAADRPSTGDLTVRWESHTAGALEVNLPADLDRRFGVGFAEQGLGAPVGEARFGTGEPERYAGVVTEPADDPHHVERRVNVARSRLVEAELMPVVPIGWGPVAMPFRDPTPLTLGRPDAAARLYLSEPGLAAGFLLLRAAEPGLWGNDITVTCRAAGPAIYDLEVSYAGSRFESARAVVFGGAPESAARQQLPTAAQALLDPGPVGVGTAKAAGVRATVTRDRVAGPHEKETP